MRRLSLQRSPYHHLMAEEENFRRWVESIERGSVATAAVYFRRLGYFSAKLNVGPGRMAGIMRASGQKLGSIGIPNFQKHWTLGYL